MSSKLTGFSTEWPGQYLGLNGPKLTSIQQSPTLFYLDSRFLSTEAAVLGGSVSWQANRYLKLYTNCVRVAGHHLGRDLD
jgi:hypothetical protein